MNSLFQNETGSLKPQEKWNLIKDQLKVSIDHKLFETWIEPLKLKSTKGSELIVVVPNLLFYQGLHDFFDKIEYSKTLLGIDDTMLRFEVDAEGEPLKEESTSPLEISNHESTAENDKSSTAFSRALSTKYSNIDSNYTFDNFVKGPSNQFALATCQNVAENPGRSYNPLFIYGSSGLGKTHLMYAVGNRVLQNNPNALVVYVSSERFMNEMIYCIRFNKMWDFRQRYRQCDVLLVDDIQFISNGKSTQEEFFHTFNSLYETKKQIVITSDKFPQEIPDIEERLRNRFQWGLIADIQPPDIEHRIAILLNKADKIGIRLNYDVAEYIATNAKRNIRELEGALSRIAAYSTLQGLTLDLKQARDLFHSTLAEAPKRLTIEVVQQSVADHFKVKISDLKSKKRHRAMTLPRQVAMYLSRSLTKSSFPEIGEKFGGKDHTTVMHAVKKIERERHADMDLKVNLDALERRLEQIH